MSLQSPAALAAVIVASAFACFTPAAVAADEDFTIWVEAEQPTQDRMNRHPWWYDQVDKKELSGGDWISNFKRGEAGQALYRFRAPGGQARFLVRANPANNELRYRLNDGPWTPVPFDRAVDRRNVAADGQNDLRFIAWVDIGEVALRDGINQVVFRTSSANTLDEHGAIDCFVFTTDDRYEPVGTAKPGEEAATVTGGVQDAWAFRPALDRLSDDALLDLRHLNEDRAGETGFVRLSDDGNSFVKGDGTPIRFWAVNSYEFRDLDLEQLTRHAEFLAKRGVNMARWHGQLPDRSEGSELGDIDEQALADLHKYVAAFNEAGIYLTISPYYPHAVGQVPASWDVPDGSTGMTGLIYFDPATQAGYKQWLKEMMTRENPHTGRSLAQEPGVAIVQMQNEDSLLFWTFTNITGEAAEMLADRFGTFLADKYGSLDAARDRLGSTNPQGPVGGIEDDWDAGRVALSNLWILTQPRSQNPAQAQRHDDQTQFLTMLMRDWHAEVARYLKEDLGSPHVFNAGNWKTADELLLDDHERYSYVPTDNSAVGINRYTTSLHEGEHRGWAIVNGDTVRNDSMLFEPDRLQVNLKQVEGHPYIISESLWVPPMWYQAEGPWLTAAYSSLGGTDVNYWFATGEPQWRQAGSANGFLPSIGKWKLATPGHLGMFPAASLIFRNGYLDEGDPVVVEHRTPQELWERQAPVISAEGGYDPNRDDIAPAGSNDAGRRTAVPRDAFLVGQVKVAFEEGEDQIADLAPHVSGERVTSNTGQLVWDKAAGVATMNAPKAQGAVGFLADMGRIDLADSSVTYSPPEHADSELAVNTGYAAVSIVPLDDTPLATSGKVLVQVGTVARPTGWEVAEIVHEDGEPAYEVVDFGKAPWQIEKASNLTIVVRNPGLTTATALDPNGMPAGEVALEKVDGGVRLAFPADAMYVVLQ
jgi:hypothetical protein